MASVQPKPLAPLLILRILEDHSDENHCKACYLQNDKLSEIDLRVILDALSGRVI